MNMPPLPYLKRIPWREAKNAAAASPTPASGRTSITKDDAVQSGSAAFRLPEDKENVLQVGLPTNFKAARFESEAQTAFLRSLKKTSTQPDSSRRRDHRMPVKFKVHDWVFVPLAKWPMLIAGNYRCVQKDAARSIKEAVHTDLEATLGKSTTGWVKLCVSLGAAEKDLVPFEKYANAALSLGKSCSSSAARALFAGAPNIERVDRLVQTIGEAKRHAVRRAR